MCVYACIWYVYCRATVFSQVFGELERIGNNVLQISCGYLISVYTLLMYFDKPNLFLITSPHSLLVNGTIVTLAAKKKFM